MRYVVTSTLGACAAALTAWWFWQPAVAPSAADADSTRSARVSQLTARAARPASPVPRIEPPASPQGQASVAVSKQTPVDYPDPAPGGDPGVVPHPIDEARLRITAQRALFTRLDDAIGNHDFRGARALLDEHDRTYGAGESWQDLREAYQLIIDCEQNPGTETSTRGRRFIDEQRGSTMRRRVRRACAPPTIHAANAGHDRPREMQ